MPCDCSHMEPKAREREGREVCQHLLYVGKQMGVKWPTWVTLGADYIYGPVEPDGVDGHTGGPRVDHAVDILCSALRVIESTRGAMADRVIYDGRNPKARALATWWDHHKKTDKKAGR